MAKPKGQKYIVRPRIMLSELQAVLNELDAAGYSVAFLEAGKLDTSGDKTFVVIGERA